MVDTKVSICYMGSERIEYKFISLAPFHLAGCLRHFDISCNVVEFTPENYRESSIVESLLGKDIVGFSCNTFTYPFLLAVLRKLKECSPDTITVMGGIHMLRHYATILQKEPVDFVIRGEADNSFGRLILALQKGQSVENIPGLTFRKSDHSIHCNPMDKLSLNRSCPLPAYDLVTKETYIFTFETSRGCPFRCFFCSLNQDSNWRGYSPAMVMDRLTTALTLLNNRNMIRHILFSDDNFATNQKRAASILKGIHLRYPDLSFWFETHVREILRNPIVLQVCKEEAIKISSLLFGIECGYDEGLKRIGKNTTLDEVRQCAKLLQDMGLEQGTIFSYIVGFPWETSKERMQTLQFAREMHEHYGVKGTCFYWFPAPSPLTNYYGIQPDYSIPFWWRKYQQQMHETAAEQEIELMAEINRSGEFPRIF